ncbi:hypothetical protein Pfo_019955 [Paulownia fortunei]|nr:hypothetical protein Pfo_019955 [Paulownia fortunei]
METCEREMGSESETRIEWEDPVTYWQERSRRALASQGVVVPRRRPPELLPDVIGIRRSFLCIGLDLVCNSCGEHIPKSTVLLVLRLFYSPYGSEGSPHTRYFARCPNCVAGLVLGRNIGDVETLVVISGAIDQHFPAKDPNLQNEVSQEPIP